MRKLKVIYNLEWDPFKARDNITKHKVSFEQAATVFKDPNAISIFDNDHSAGEDRWITMGLTSNGILIVVHHTYKLIDNETGEIRVISSRKASKKEKKQYVG
jgi:uncharacterized protein